MLNPDSPLPLYHQLAELLEADIVQQRYREGQRLPSEHELAARYSLGRPTVRQATELLVRKGMAERRRGSGTYVRGMQSKVDLFSLVGTHQAFRSHGASVETRTLAPLAAVTVPRCKDNPFSDQTALLLSRLTRVEKSPLVLEHIYLCKEMFSPMLAFDLHGQSLSDLVQQKLSLRPKSAQQDFSVRLARGKIARTLGVGAGTPLLYVQRHIHFRVQANAIYVELNCRTDRMAFSQTIEGPDHA